MPTVKGFEHGLQSTESIFNVAGFLPIISIFSGGVRIILGTVQGSSAVIAAVALALFAKATQSTDTQRNDKRWNRAEYAWKVQAKHGFANVIRGFFEMIPGTGCFMCFYFNKVRERMTYPTQLTVAQEKKMGATVFAQELKREGKEGFMEGFRRGYNTYRH